MADNLKISETKLLYDPIFSQKPDIVMKGKKNLIFKAVFIVVIVIFVGISLFFSFYSLSSAKYTYKNTDDGWQLYQFNGKEDDVTLHIDWVRDENGVANEAEAVSTVRSFAMSCNEYVQFIFIGRDVKELDTHCFYYTKNLKAVIVDPQNEYYTSVDGVLFNKDMTEIILHPICNYQYRTALEAGFEEPTDEKTAKDFNSRFGEKYGTETVDNVEEYKKQFTVSTYEIPDTVTTVTDSCFSDCDTLTYVSIPDSVKTIGSLAFFKCKSFETVNIPDSVEFIGSDGFSYCERLTYIFVPQSVKTIGHHAFYGNLGCEKIYMGASDESQVETGEHWLPKESTRSMKDIEAVYGQTRRDK